MQKVTSKVKIIVSLKYNLLKFLSYFVAAGIQCKIPAFGCDSRRMLSIFQSFDKHCNCHLQVECVVVRRIFEALYRCGEVLMLKTANTSEKSENFYQPTRRYNPKDSHFHTHLRENLKPHRQYWHFT
jgi:hypothetical protein